MFLDALVSNLYFFDDPLFLLLGIPIILIPFLISRLKKKELALRFSSLQFKSVLPAQSNLIFRLTLWLRVITLILLVITLGNPKSTLQRSTEYKESLDIIITLDISSSMEMEDLTPNRLTVAKKNIINFINKRTYDRLGLVIFGSEAFLQCPLTYDHNLLGQFVNNIDFLPNISEQTAVGSAISSAVLALKNSKAKTKIIILLTDGDNNAGDISPTLAAELAQKYNIKIYSIGVGKPGQSIVYRIINDPIYGRTRIPFVTTLNETELKNISTITGGKYFNVQSESNLQKTYEQIDRLEKTKIELEEYNLHKQNYYWFLNIALIILGIEILLSETILRRFP